MGGLNKLRGQSQQKKLWLVTCIIASCDKHKLFGKLLRASTTTSTSKGVEGPRLTIVPNGKNVEDWKIRSQVSTSVKTRIRERFNDYTCLGLKSLVNSNDSLRYSLVPSTCLRVLKYTERWGINVHTLIKYALLPCLNKYCIKLKV